MVTCEKHRDALQAAFLVQMQISLLSGFTQQLALVHRRPACAILKLEDLRL